LSLPPEDLPGPAAAAPPAAPSRRLGADEIGFAALLLLSLGGVAIADFSARWGLSYWLAMVPLFAAASVYTGWERARGRGQGVGSVVLSQALHWGALALAVYLIFLLERTGRLNREDAGLVAMLSLSLTTLLAGVHFDWRLAVLGALVGVAAACSALVEEFFWMLLVPAVVAGAAVIFWQRRRA
jgi:hypothetical protein